jgi:gliding motility-associated-like protein
MKLLISIAFMFPILAFGQLVTNTSQTPNGLVQNVLLGPGVTVSNISYSGSQQAIGYFSAAGTNLEIPEGIVLTTGTVLNTGEGPHGPNNSTNAGLDNNAPGYFRLSNLVSPSTTFNAAVLEFDFIPYSDTVRFSYVFGSEEYREYVNSNFNDVFAFFISGPGIPGGIQNMARLPNNTIVAINNVNDGSESTGTYVPNCANCTYYKYNGTGSNGPYNSSSTYIQYDGFTRPLEAVAKVQCGQTYHLSIAIADVGDGIFDSGIFLQANSLTSKVPVSVDYTMSYDAFNDPTIMAEGCVSTTVTLTRGSNNLSTPLIIPISVNGTATAGVDYSNIPSSVTFPAGQTTVSFTFNALADGSAEGIETVNLVFAIPDPCGGNSSQTINLKINDIAPVQVAVVSEEVLCPGNPTEVIANATGGVGPYVYSWNTGETTSSILVNPSSTQTYTVSVTDNCLLQTAVGSGTVTVPVFQPLTATSSPDITEICPYLPATLSATASGGAEDYTYQWSAGSENLGTNATQDVLPSTSTTYNVLITDRCGNVTTEQVIYTITSPPLTLSMSPAQLICPGDSAFVSVTASGGFGQFYYNWLINGATTDGIWVKPSETTSYIVSVSDECQTFAIEGTALVEVIRPNADFAISSHTLFEGLPITFQNLTSGGVTYVWSFGDGNSSTMVHPNNTYQIPGTYTVTLIATNQLGCKDTVSKPIIILPEYYIYVPNAFTPDGNRSNSYFSASTVNIAQLNVKIFNRWGELIFESNELDFAWDGTYKGLKVQDGIFVYKIEYVTTGAIEDTIVGHVVLLK